MQLSIIIPVYNSSKILPHLINRLNVDINFVDSFEVILVNDCSPDNSWNIVKEQCEQYDFVKGIDLRKNVGQHNAVMAGLNYANGQVIIMMDDDLQHDPKYIKSFYNTISDGYDVCYTKYLNRKDKLFKTLGSKFNNLVANILLDKPSHLYLSSFKAINQDIKNEIITYDGPYPYLDGLILSKTNSIATIEIEHKERFEGKSNYSIYKLVSLWLKMATSFSVLPLRVATFIGLTISFLSFLFGLYFVFLKLMYNSAPEGWTSLMVVILFLGGVQLFSIGILGEYIGRSYLRLNKKSQFVIKEIKKGKKNGRNEY